MKIYIAGKITGDRNYRRKFAEVASQYRDKGNIILNPAVLPLGMSAADYMRICLAMIDTADMVVFLPDWLNSRGASVELEYCNYICKPIKVYDGSV